MANMSMEEATALAEKHIDTFDVLLDDRVPPDDAAAFILACIRSKKDPMKEALHFVKLRKAFRGES